MADAILKWHRFDTIRKARRTLREVAIIYVLADKDEQVLRIGQSSDFWHRFKGGTGWMVDALMHGSGKVLYAAEAPADPSLRKDIEAALIFRCKPPFCAQGKSLPPTRVVEVEHQGEVPKGLLENGGQPRSIPEGSVNLFRSLRYLAKGHEEDYLTEFVAAALTTSAAFRRAYAELALAAYARARGWGHPEIASIKTQVDYPGAGGQPGCWPDMRLTLGDGHRILCEHKIEAGETEGPGLPGGGEPGQLERYLALPEDGLVYVRASWEAVAPAVLSHPRYVKPREGHHFLWRHLYPLFAAEPSDSPLLGWLREGFEELGFTPPLPEIGDLDDPDETVRRRNRENFSKLWGPTRSAAQRLGWKVYGGAGGSSGELWLDSNPRALAGSIWISPCSAGRFLVRVTPRHEADPDAIRTLLERVPSPVSPELEVATVPRKEGPTRVIQVASTLRAILGDAGDPAEFERRLIGFVEPWLRALERNADSTEGKEG